MKRADVVWAATDVVVQRGDVWSLGDIRKYSDDEPRDDHGQWTDGGGGGEGDATGGAQGHAWDQPVGHDGRPIPIRVSTVEQAIPMVLAGKVVELPDAKTAATLVDDLGQFARAAQAEGKDAPNFNMCNITVPGTNLFCGADLRDASHPNGYPRIEMPQLGGIPVRGTPADALPRTPWNPNEVDGAAQFISSLRAGGIKVTDGEELVGHLKATQNELVGTKVAKLMGETIDTRNALFISRDNYVVDGHHRWAALVGQAAEHGALDKVKASVHRIDAPISEILPLANKWSKQFGIASQAGGKSVKAQDCGCAQRKYSDDQPRDDGGRWTSGGDSGGSTADTSGDTGRLSAGATNERAAAFAARYGQATALEAAHLAADWYTMRPQSHLDAFLQGTLADGPEKTAWAAVQQDTQTRLASEVKGDVVDLYRGIPGKDIADAVGQAKASGAAYAVIPIHDSHNVTHEAVCATGQVDLAEAYAASRWTRHGGDAAEAHTGVVMHLRVPKADVVFSTSHSAFANPYTPGWNEYVVRTGGSATIRLPLKDIEVIGATGNKLFEPSQANDVMLPVGLTVRLHPAEAVSLGNPKSLKYSDDQPRDDDGRWSDGGGSGGDSSASSGASSGHFAGVAVGDKVTVAGTTAGFIAPVGKPKTVDLIAEANRSSLEWMLSEDMLHEAENRAERHSAAVFTGKASKATLSFIEHALTQDAAEHAATSANGLGVVINAQTGTVAMAGGKS